MKTPNSLRNFLAQCDRGEIIGRHGAAYRGQSKIHPQRLKAAYERGLIEPKYEVGGFGHIRPTRKGRDVLEGKES